MSSNYISVLLYACLFAEAQGCYSGWLQDRSTCYYFSTFATTWTEAGSFCERFGGKLAEPNDQSKIHFLAGAVKNESGSQYFMGGSDIFVEGEWIWTSNMARIDTTNWNPGEPNDDDHRGDCLTIWHSGLWNDNQCTHNLYFICEVS